MPGEIKTQTELAAQAGIIDRIIAARGSRNSRAVRPRSANVRGVDYGIHCRHPVKWGFIS